MSNQLPRAFTRALVLALFVLACFSAALAQTPSPTPVNPATQPPGQEQVPPATAPPGTNVVPQPSQPRSNQRCKNRGRRISLMFSSNLCHRCRISRG